MTRCAVENCESPATREIPVSATLNAGNGPYSRPPLTRVDIRVPLCEGHHDVLTHDAMRGLSLA